MFGLINMNLKKTLIIRYLEKFLEHLERLTEYVFLKCLFNENLKSIQGEENKNCLY